jgi:hypothetical protein
MSDSKLNIDTSGFHRISLLESEKAQLMQRIDSKFIIHHKLSKEILSKSSEHYYIVDNNGQVIPEYISDYYDTTDFRMYLDHHNRRPKRYKIRVRNYCASGDSFLEIKLRTPAGKTIKKRIPATTQDLNQGQISEFIKEKTPYKFEELTKTLETKFNRLTLVAKDFDERITFDFNLRLSIPESNNTVNYSDICIVEIKRSKQKSNSEISSILKSLGIHSFGFSKYSIGCALLYPTFKSNNFKETLLYLKKLRNEYNEPNYVAG